MNSQSCALLLSLCLGPLTACAGPHLTAVDLLRTPGGVPIVAYKTDTGSSLVVATDQAVENVQLARSPEGTLLLSWQGQEPNQRWSVALELAGQQHRIVTVNHDRDARPVRIQPAHLVSFGSQTLLLQGNGEAHVLNDELDLRVRVGSNALAYLGVHLSAGKVVSVLPGSPASAAGLREGDALVGLAHGGQRQALENRVQLAELLPRLRPGEVVQLYVLRDGQEVQLNVTLGERPIELWNRSDG